MTNTTLNLSEQDLVVLNRSDVSDANFSLAVASDRPDHPIFKTSKGIFFTYSDNKNKWIECRSINNKTTGLKALPVKEAVETNQTIKVKGFENLIGGTVALQAVLNGQTVQLSLEPWEKKHWDDFIPGIDETSTKVFFTEFHGEQKVFFRIKPKTININGIEVPAPFKPNVDEKFWHLYPSMGRGYNFTTSIDSDHYEQFGAWRTEKEIKQVVEALRKVLGVQP